MRTQCIVGLTVALIALGAAAVRAQVADLSLTASAQELTNTLTVGNPGPATATGVVVINQIQEMDSVFPGRPNSNYDVETLYLTPSNRINLSFRYPPNDSLKSYNQLRVFLQPYIPASGIIHRIFFAFHKIPSAKYVGEKESIRQLGARSERLSQIYPLPKRTCSTQGQI
jgi:uncharacterized repeat protein (TIGR01451 family)